MVEWLKGAAFPLSVSGYLAGSFQGTTPAQDKIANDTFGENTISPKIK